MGEINWTDEAERWLKDIHDYIVQDSPESAVRVVEAIYEKAQLLGRFPEVGHRYDRIPDRHERTLACRSSGSRIN